MRGDFINVYKYLRGGCEEIRVRLFALVSSARTKDNGHNLENEKFRLNIRKHFLTMWGMEH